MEEKQLTTHITARPMQPIAQFLIRTMRSDMEATKQGKPPIQTGELPLVSITEAPTPLKPFSSLSKSLPKQESSQKLSESLLKRAPETKKEPIPPPTLPTEIKKSQIPPPPANIKIDISQVIQQAPPPQKTTEIPKPSIISAPATIQPKPPSQSPQPQPDKSTASTPPKPATPAPKEEKKTTPATTPSLQPQKIQTAKTKQLKIALAVILGIFILATISGAAYYFLYLKQPAEPPPPPPPPPIETPKPLVSTDSTQVISIKDKSELVSELTSVLASPQSEGTLKYIPIKITDPEERFISFQELIDNLNFKIPASVMDQYAGQYSLIIYSQKEGDVSPFLKNLSRNRLCLILAMKEGADIKNDLLFWETAMFEDLSSLYLNFSTKPIPGAAFADSERTDVVPHRFINLNTSYLSLDYALYSNKLMIATSKESVSKIIDKMINAD